MRFKGALYELQGCFLSVVGPLLIFLHGYSLLVLRRYLGLGLVQSPTSRVFYYIFGTVSASRYFEDIWAFPHLVLRGYVCIYISLIQSPTSSTYIGVMYVFGTASHI